jgi:signal transduction histidine kinase
VTTIEDRRREQAIEAYQVLDAPPRRELLALVELAARAARVPMAAIDLITATEQRQVATYGFPPAVCTREESLSARVVGEGRPALVSDTLLDDRFRTNPFAAGKLGEVRFYAAHPLVTPEGVVIGTLCVFDDQPHEVLPELELLLGILADRVVDLLQLELTTRRLEAADERLGAFAARVSHDLKNPLAAVRMSLELARDEVADGDTDVAQLLDRAQRGTHRINAIIGELLTFARGATVPDRRPVTLDEQMEHVLEDLADVTRPGQVVVGPLPEVSGDQVQLRTVLQNLVANAVKFSDPGAPVTVTAERGEGGWRVKVADRGPGIAPEDRERAFEPLVRLDGTVPGTGIGLATCRRVVEAHGGRMGIDANPEGGAIVWFELPD